MEGSGVEESFSLKSDLDWNEEDEKELQAIESSYAASKRRRRLPDWAHVASPSANSPRRLSTGNGLCNFTPAPCRGSKLSSDVIPYILFAFC